MARIRTIKPEFWQDELVASWPPFSRLAYIAMWNEADDEGRLRASGSYLRSRIFPYEVGLDILAVIAPIVETGRLLIYSVDGQTYGMLPNFNRHQLINRPSRSKLPPFTLVSQTTHCQFSEDSVNDPGIITDDSLGEGKGRELKEPFQEEKPIIQGTLRENTAPARPTESQEPPNIDDSWNVPDDEFGDEGYDSVPMGVDALDVALASFNETDQQKLIKAGATVADCDNIAELTRLSGGTLESVEREK